MQRKIMNLIQILEARSLFPTIEPVFQKTSSSQGKGKQQHEQKKIINNL